MKMISLLSVALFFLVSCNSAAMNFNVMTDEEILAYNQTVGQWEQVYCEERASVRSRVPRRRCRTLLQMHQQDVGNVDAINAVSSGKPIITIQ
ncbi:MAG: hypothetical protein VB962_01140 [Pseudohongiellaceae bacterium]